MSSGLTTALQFTGPEQINADDDDDVTLQFSRLAAIRFTFSKKTEKPVFRCGLRNLMYQISGILRFSFGQEA